MIDGLGDSPEARVAAVLQQLQGNGGKRQGKLDEATLLWLGAKAAEQASQVGRARAWWKQLADGESPLAGMALYHFARLTRDPAERIGIVVGGEVDPLVAKAATGLRVDALLSLGNYGEAQALLARRMGDQPAVRHGAQEHWRMAKALLGLRRRGQAIPWLRSLVVHFPTASETVMAAKRLVALGGFRERDRLAMAERLYELRRYDRALRVLRRLVSSKTVSACSVRLIQGKVHVRQRRYSQADRFLSMAERFCGQRRLPTVLYLLGRSSYRSGKLAKAKGYYARLLQRFSEDDLSDDALFALASLSRDMGNVKGYESNLRELVDVYPTGDQVNAARRTLAVHFLGKASKTAKSGPRSAFLHQARTLFGSLAEEKIDQRLEGAEGRSQYWRARCDELAGLKLRAVRGYVSVMRKWPISYYGAWARGRLRRLDPSRMEKLDGALLRQRRDHLGSTRFPDGKRRAWWDKFSALLQVQEERLAMSLLRREVGHPTGEDRAVLWQAAARFTEYDAWSSATELVRRHLRDFAYGTPVAAERYWRTGYVQGHAPLLDTAAREAGVSVFLTRAIAREESSFRASAVSRARAHGVMQVIEPTARRFCGGMRCNATTLKDPKINLVVATRFLAYLKGVVPDELMIPAAYNAGWGAVRRWVRTRGRLPLDLWVESIPYDETRRYTRRVLQTRGVYRWLHTQEPPAF